MDEQLLGKNSPQGNCKKFISPSPRPKMRKRWKVYALEKNYFKINKLGVWILPKIPRNSFLGICMIVWQLRGKKTGLQLSCEAADADSWCQHNTTRLIQGFFTHRKRTISPLNIPAYFPIPCKESVEDWHTPWLFPRDGSIGVHTGAEVL